MSTSEKNTIVIETTINSEIEKVWSAFTNPNDIILWNSASPDWHTPRAENDLRVGGKFLYRMEAKDGSFGFDFSGVYEEIKTNEFLAFKLDDGRKVRVEFASKDSQTQITESFEAEEINSLDLQKMGWQAILDNFKKHVEKEVKNPSLS